MYPEKQIYLSLNHSYVTKHCNENIPSDILYGFLVCFDGIKFSIGLKVASAFYTAVGK